MRSAVEAIWRDPSAPADHPVLAAHKALLEGQPLMAPVWTHSPDDVLLAKAHALVAIGGLDLDALRVLLVHLDTLPCDDAGSVERALLVAWHKALSLGEDDGLERLGADAARHGLGLARVETLALRAFVLGTRGKPEEALRAARRCSLMASTEALPLTKVIAGWALARARRQVGHSFLTLPICTSARELGGAHFGPLLAWEAGMAGAPDAEFPGSSLTNLIADPTGKNALRTLRPLLVQSRPYADETDALRRARGVETVVSDEVDGWCSGLDIRLPASLRGVFGGEPDRPFGWLRLTRDAMSRQLTLRDAPGIPPRVLAAYAALAAAESFELHPNDLFYAVYGFAYEPAVHGALFRKLVSRMRKCLGGERAEVSKEAGKIRLRVEEELWLPDPDCVPTALDRVRWVFSQMPRSTVRQVAEACSLPTRTVQRVAQDMVDAGVLSSRRIHRQVLYRVEDSVWTHATNSVRAD